MAKAKQATTAKAAAKTVTVTLVKSPIGFNRNQGAVGRRASACAGSATRWS